MWRSPEAHLHGVQGAVGSNPITPTILEEKRSLFREAPLLGGLGNLMLVARSGKRRPLSTGEAGEKACGHAVLLASQCAVMPFCCEAGCGLACSARRRDRRLRPGFFVRLQVISAERPNTVVIPESAVVLDGSTVTAYVLVEDTAELRILELGRRTDDDSQPGPRVEPAVARAFAHAGSILAVPQRPTIAQVAAQPFLTSLGSGRTAAGRCNRIGATAPSQNYSTVPECAPA